MGARAKDVIETKLSKQVCTGTITLESAQKQIYNWANLYMQLKLQKK